MTRTRRATAMVMALVALVVTSAISVEMVRTASLYRSADRDLLLRRQAQLLAEGAVERAMIAHAASPKYAGETWEPEQRADEGARSTAYPIFLAEINVSADSERIIVKASVGESETRRAVYQLEVPVGVGKEKP
jgi:hypothetical protein